MVSFGEVEVIELAMTIGHHPCAYDDGVSITTSWEVLDTTVIDVDVYEFIHPPRRSSKELRWTLQQREEILFRCGHCPSTPKTRATTRKQAQVSTKSPPARRRVSYTKSADKALSAPVRRSSKQFCQQVDRMVLSAPPSQPLIRPARSA